MLQVDLPPIGTAGKILAAVIVVLGQTRNIVLLVREVRSWWRKPKTQHPTRLPPSL